MKCVRALNSSFWVIGHDYTNDNSDDQFGDHEIEQLNRAADGLIVRNLIGVTPHTFWFYYHT